MSASDVWGNSWGDSWNGSWGQAGAAPEQPAAPRAPSDVSQSFVNDYRQRYEPLILKRKKREEEFKLKTQVTREVMLRIRATQAISRMSREDKSKLVRRMEQRGLVSLGARRAA